VIVTADQARTIADYFATVLEREGASSADEPMSA
jgi:hypothetical protein